MNPENFPNQESEEKSFKESLLDDNNPQQKDLVEDIFSRNESNPDSLKWVTDLAGQSEIRLLIGEYGIVSDISDKKRIRQRIEQIVDAAYDAAHEEK